MDQNHRQLASDLILAFLSAKIDETHHTAYSQIKDSEDDTVRFACEILEELVEGYDDEPNLMDKEEWDHLERVRLVLLSSRHLSCHGKSVFEPTPLVAVLSLFAYLITLLYYGIGWYLVPVYAFSVLTGLIFARSPESIRSKNPYQFFTYPFVTYSQLADAYREAEGFKKKKMPREAQRYKQSSWFGLVIAYVLLMPFAPLFLLINGLEGSTEYRVTSA